MRPVTTLRDEDQNGGSGLLHESSGRRCSYLMILKLAPKFSSKEKPRESSVGESEGGQRLEYKVTLVRRSKCSPFGDPCSPPPSIDLEPTLIVPKSR